MGEGISSNSNTRILSQKGEAVAIQRPSSLYGSWGAAVHTLARCFLSWGFPAPVPQDFPRRNIKTVCVIGTQTCSHTHSRFSALLPGCIHPHILTQPLCSKRYSRKARKRPPLWPCKEVHIHTSPWTSQNLTFPSHKVGRRSNILQLGFGSHLGVGDEGKAVPRGPNSSLISTTPHWPPVLSVLSTLIQLLQLKKAARPTCCFFQPGHRKEKSMQSKSSPQNYSL